MLHHRNATTITCTLIVFQKSPTSVFEIQRKNINFKGKVGNTFILFWCKHFRGRQKKKGKKTIRSRKRLKNMFKAKRSNKNIRAWEKKFIYHMMGLPYHFFSDRSTLYWWCNVVLKNQKYFIKIAFNRIFFDSNEYSHVHFILLSTLASLALVKLYRKKRHIAKQPKNWKTRRCLKNCSLLSVSLFPLFIAITLRNIGRQVLFKNF